MEFGFCGILSLLFELLGKKTTLNLEFLKFITFFRLLKISASVLLFFIFNFVW